MVWRDPFSPKHSLAKDSLFASVKVKVLRVAVAFLALTITLVALQPRAGTVDIAALDPVPDVVKAPAARPEVAVSPESEAEPSHVLRQPIQNSRLGQQYIDLPRLATQALRDYDYTVEDRDRRRALLLAVPANEMSDAYIDAFLNSAASRCAFSPPVSLRLSSGCIETPTLRSAMVRAARS